MACQYLWVQRSTQLASPRSSSPSRKFLFTHFLKQVSAILQLMLFLDVVYTFEFANPKLGLHPQLTCTNHERKSHGRICTTSCMRSPTLRPQSKSKGHDKLFMRHQTSGMHNVIAKKFQLLSGYVLKETHLLKSSTRYAISISAIVTAFSASDDITPSKRRGQAAPSLQELTLSNSPCGVLQPAKASWELLKRRPARLLSGHSCYMPICLYLFSLNFQMRHNQHVWYLFVY